MTDTTTRNGHHTTVDAKLRLKKRYRAQTRLKAAGILSILFAALALVALLYSIGSRMTAAVSETHIVVDVMLERETIDPKGTGNTDDISQADYTGLIKKALRKKFPGLARSDKRELYRLISDAAPYELRNRVVADPKLIGKTLPVQLLADDDVDLFVKRRIAKVEKLEATGLAHPTGTKGDVAIYIQSNAFGKALDIVRTALSAQADVLQRQADAQKRASETTAALLRQATSEDEKGKIAARKKTYDDKYAFLMKRIADLRARALRSGGSEPLDTHLPSVLVAISGGVVKATEIASDHIKGKVLVTLKSARDVQSNNWQLLLVATPEDDRKVSDYKIAWLHVLKAENRVKQTFNWHFLQSADASEPEEAGIFGGLMGTFWTMLVTFVLSFPIGVLGAIYLEEFAPKNAFTHLIEININNLAAVPSIIFGLLGLAVFINFFGLPYSSSLVGGMVLALMTLPTVIIASRAAIKAVPPSIKEAALGVGASRTQVVFHHVLPLAMPGILTGSILGMAQALGETAPLLMIGMVAFIADPPMTVTDSASSLPVLIYLWADRAELAFDMRTAAAIMVLLGFLLAMNGLAILLRKRFERRW